MPSPFPGMNPCIEQETAWHDFHESFMPLAREIINAQVMPRYFAKIDEHIYVHDVDDNSRRLLGRGDVTIVPANPPSGQPASTELLEAPVEVLQPSIDEERISFLEIRDRDSHQLVTVLELLSPVNKNPGKYRNQYLAKREQILDSEVQFVEIDLLRGGPRMPWRTTPRCDYCVVVSRAQRRPRAGLWPIQLRQPLPAIPIPLHEQDRDATIDLQAVLHRIYDAAGYAIYIYDGKIDPPLSQDDAAWAQKLLARKPAQ